MPIQHYRASPFLCGPARNSRLLETSGTSDWSSTTVYISTSQFQSALRLHFGMDLAVAFPTEGDEIFLGIMAESTSGYDVVNFQSAREPQDWQRQPSRSKTDRCNDRIFSRSKTEPRAF